jgi:hypothetical protein
MATLGNTLTSEEYITSTILNTTSGNIVAQIPSLSGYATETWANSTFIDNTEMTTISGDLSSRITAAAVKYLTYDRSTNLTYSVSLDGKNFDTLINSITMARASFLTPAYIGVFTGHGNVSIATGITRMRARIFHWSLTQP